MINRKAISHHMQSMKMEFFGYSSGISRISKIEDKRAIRLNNAKSYIKLYVAQHYKSTKKLFYKIKTHPLQKLYEK